MISDTANEWLHNVMKKIKGRYGECKAAKNEIPGEDMEYMKVYTALIANGIPPNKFPMENLIIPSLPPRINTFILTTNIAEGAFAKPITKNQMLINALKRAEELGDRELIERIRSAISNEDYIIDVDPIEKDYIDELGEEIYIIAKAEGVELSKENAEKAASSILTYLSECGIQPKVAVESIPLEDIITVSSSYIEIFNSFKRIFSKACEMLKSGNYTYEDIIYEYNRLSEQAKSLEDKVKYAEVAQFFSSLVSGVTVKPSKKLVENVAQEIENRMARPQPFNPNTACEMAIEIPGVSEGKVGVSNIVEDFANSVLNKEPVEEQCKKWRNAVYATTCYVYQRLNALHMGEPYEVASQFFHNSIMAEPVTMTSKLKKDVFEGLLERAKKLREAYTSYSLGMSDKESFLSALKDLMENMLLASKIMVSICEIGGRGVRA